MRVVRLLFPPDPGALRLLAALRATLAGVLTFFLVMLLGSVATVPVTDRILGFGIALFIAANVRDGTPLRRFVTIALAPLFAFTATALAAFLHDQPLAAAVLLPLLMFTVAYGATRGPRWASLGIVALIAYFIGLVTHEPPATLPMRFVVVALAAGNAALVRCVLLRERPLTELNRLRRAIHADLVRVLARVGSAVAAGTWSDGAREELRRAVNRLDEVVMLAQARVAALAAEIPSHGRLWLHLLEVELGTERVARVALRDLGASADRAALLAALTALQRGTTPPLLPAATGLASALALLAHVIRDGPRDGPAPAAAPPPVSAAPGLRSAVQTALASALAIAVGDLVSPNRWYWAAFAAFVMFQGTRSRGETIAKGMQFVVGTLAGVLCGMLVATLLSGHEILTMTAIVVAVFLAFQANVAAYGTMVFWLTVILGLLFGMLGFFPPDLLLLRLKEAAVGAACGAVVACLVLVRGERVAMGDAIGDFLRALGRSVDGGAHALLGGTPPADLAACILTAEQRFRDMSAIARTERLGLAVGRDEPLRRLVLVLEGCELWARELGQIGLRSAALSDPGQIRLVGETVARIDEALSGLINRVTNRSAIVTTDDERDEALVDVQADDLPRAVRLLLRIDAALVHTASR